MAAVAHLSGEVESLTMPVRSTVPCYSIISDQPSDLRAFNFVKVVRKIGALKTHI